MHMFENLSRFSVQRIQEPLYMLRLLHFVVFECIGVQVLLKDSPILIPPFATIHECERPTYSHPKTISQYSCRPGVTDLQIS